jgi:hypothetical protein
MLYAQLVDIAPYVLWNVMVAVCWGGPAIAVFVNMMLDRRLPESHVFFTVGFYSYLIVIWGLDPGSAASTISTRASYAIGFIGGIWMIGSLSSKPRSDTTGYGFPNHDQGFPIIFREKGPEEAKDTDD